MRVLLRNREMKVWMVEISKIRGAMFSENGWEKVVNDNCVTDGDLLFFIYKDYDVFDFFVVDPFGCEKIGMEGERARVVEVIRKESGDESLDIFVLEANICKRVKKYVKKEEGSDLDTCISVNKDVKKEEDTDSDGNAREENDDDHHRLYIQPENAYLVTRIRQKRRGDLYVPKEVIRDYNLQLPSTVTLRDAKDRKWKTIVKVWADGQTWLSRGWRGLCQRNLIEEEDQRQHEIPSYTESERRDLKMRVLLRNREMKVWMVEISKIQGAMFFENGWEKVVKDNCVTDGDLLFFIYKDYDVFDFFVVDPFGCEKIGVEGERARVVEVIRKESGDESLDIFVLEANICKRVKKYVKKEEGSDLDTCISVNKDVKKEEDTDSDGNAREENDDDHHSGSKKAIPDHYGADLFLSGRYTQPENAYFVTRIRRKRRGDLLACFSINYVTLNGLDVQYVPKEVIRDYNLQLPSTVTLP
nr:B3 domain-containing protein At5g60130-like isoform X1 [Ipomoea trifida]